MGTTSLPAEHPQALPLRCRDCGQVFRVDAEELRLRASHNPPHCLPNRCPVCQRIGLMLRRDTGDDRRWPAFCSRCARPIALHVPVPADPETGRAIRPVYCRPCYTEGPEERPGEAVELR